MTRFLIPALSMVLLGFGAVAQTINTQAVNDQLAKKDFVAALKQWAEVRKQISELATAELLKVVPQRIASFKLIVPTRPNDNRGGFTVDVEYRTGENAEQKAAQETSDPMARYRQGEGSEAREPIIRLSIATDLMMANEVVMAHSAEAAAMASNDNSKIEPLRINGYRALIKTDGQGAVTAMMIVGGAFVRADTQGKIDPELIKLLLASIDIVKLKTIVGE